MNAGDKIVLRSMQRQAAHEANIARLWFDYSRQKHVLLDRLTCLGKAVWHQRVSNFYYASIRQAMGIDDEQG